MSNREYSQKQKSDALASASKIAAIQNSTSAETKDKKPKGNEIGLKELDRSKEFKVFHKLLLNVVTFDPEIGHLLMIMDQIYHSETSTI